MSISPRHRRGFGGFIHQTSSKKRHRDPPLDTVMTDVAFGPSAASASSASRFSSMPTSSSSSSSSSVTVPMSDDAALAVSNSVGLGVGVGVDCFGGDAAEVARHARRRRRTRATSAPAVEPLLDSTSDARGALHALESLSSAASTSVSPTTSSLHVKIPDLATSASMPAAAHARPKFLSLGRRDGSGLAAATAAVAARQEERASAAAAAAAASGLLSLADIAQDFFGKRSVNRTASKTDNSHSSSSPSSSSSDSKSTRSLGCSSPQPAAIASANTQSHSFPASPASASVASSRPLAMNFSDASAAVKFTPAAASALPLAIPFSVPPVHLGGGGGSSSVVAATVIKTEGGSVSPLMTSRGGGSSRKKASAGKRDGGPSCFGCHDNRTKCERDEHGRLPCGRCKRLDRACIERPYRKLGRPSGSFKVLQQLREQREAERQHQKALRASQLNKLKKGHQLSVKASSDKKKHVRKSSSGSSSNGGYESPKKARSRRGSRSGSSGSGRRDSVVSPTSSISATSPTSLHSRTLSSPSLAGPASVRRPRSNSTTSTASLEAAAQQLSLSHHSPSPKPNCATSPPHLSAAAGASPTTARSPMKPPLHCSRRVKSPLPQHSRSLSQQLPKPSQPSIFSLHGPAALSQPNVVCPGGQLHPAALQGMFGIPNAHAIAQARLQARATAASPHAHVVSPNVDDPNTPTTAADSPQHERDSTPSSGGGGSMLPTLDANMLRRSAAAQNRSAPPSVHGHGHSGVGVGVGRLKVGGLGGENAFLPQNAAVATAAATTTPSFNASGVGAGAGAAAHAIPVPLVASNAYLQQLAVFQQQQYMLYMQRVQQIQQQQQVAAAAAAAATSVMPQVPLHNAASAFSPASSVSSSAAGARSPPTRGLSAHKRSQRRRLSLQPNLTPLREDEQSPRPPDDAVDADVVSSRGESHRRLSSAPMPTTPSSRPPSRMAISTQQPVADTHNDRSSVSASPTATQHSQQLTRSSSTPCSSATEQCCIGKRLKTTNPSLSLERLSDADVAVLSKSAKFMQRLREQPSDARTAQMMQMLTSTLDQLLIVQDALLGVSPIDTNDDRRNSEKQSDSDAEGDVNMQ